MAKSRVVYADSGLKYEVEYSLRPKAVYAYGQVLVLTEQDYERFRSLPGNEAYRDATDAEIEVWKQRYWDATP